ncbi:MAG: hypothetical protein JRD89_00740 [Deltaproteobacteria bacterium]|nr:hypothetical protein [Deltaproteobacteria bacterium]
MTELSGGVEYDTLRKPMHDHMEEGPTTIAPGATESFDFSYSGPWRLHQIWIFPPKDGINHTIVVYVVYKDVEYRWDGASPGAITSNPEYLTQIDPDDSEFDEEMTLRVKITNDGAASGEWEVKVEYTGG